jgi:hypothetical protein
MDGRDKPGQDAQGYRTIWTQEIELRPYKEPF